MPEPTEEYLWNRFVDSRAEFDRAIAKIKADAWRDGAQWAAVEIGAIAREENQWVTDADNPYIAKP